MEHTISINKTSTVHGSQDPSEMINFFHLILPTFILRIPIIWFILGAIGFIGNMIVFLPLKRSSQTSDVYLFISSIIDIITLSINLYLMHFLLLLQIGESKIPAVVIVACGMLIFLFFPHLSINLLLMAYFDGLIRTCKPGSPLHKLTKFKMVPWIVSFIIIFSCLALSYLPIVTLIDPGKEHVVEIHYYIACILYILTNGLIPSLLMLIIILITYRNMRESRHKSVSSTIIYNIK